MKTSFTTPRFLLGFSAAVVAFAIASSGSASEKDKKNGPENKPKRSVARVLIMTGEEHHRWQDTLPVIKKILAEDKRLKISVNEDLPSLATTDFSTYDVMVMHFQNQTPEVPGEKGYRNLEQFVKNGGGLVMIHFACGAFQERPEFVKLAGRVWNPKLRPHDPHGKFRVDIAETDHPITNGMKSFETVDELYTCLDGHTPITILATAKSKVDGKVYPMAFVLDYGKGRVFQCELGHDVQAFEAPEVRQLYRRATAWCAGLKPENEHKP